MFTQCSKCETVFRLSADALRTAGGQVRCGRCGEVFNALSRLAEDAASFVKGESPLFLETRAEEILESAEPPQVEEEIDAPPGIEIARLVILDPVDDDPAETSLEFTLPPGELDRIFIETRPSPLRQLAADGPRGERQAVEPLPVESSAIASIPAAPVQPLPPQAEALTRIAGLEVSEDVRQEMLSSYAYAELPQINAPRAALPFAAWLAAALVLGLLLVIQLVRGSTWLAAHAPLLGGSAPANLSVYQLRQWGVTGDPGAKGTLRVRASILNAAAQLQPYPLLRVTLVNRFGTRVGAREFEPAEYLGHGTARALAPGERVDATLDILDPGKDAEGFEIDVCVRSADKKIVCAGDGAAQAK